MQACIAKYQSRDLCMRTSAKSKAKGRFGRGGRHIFGKCGTNLNFTDSELLDDPEAFGVCIHLVWAGFTFQVPRGKIGPKDC